MFALNVWEAKTKAIVQGYDNECYLGGYLRGVVRVWQFGGDVEPEVIVPWNNGVTKFDHQRPRLFVCLKMEVVRGRSTVV